VRYDEFLKLVKERRSIRRFKPDPIPDDYIEKIIEVARWAPSGFNQQPWEIVVIKKAELRKKIAELCGEYVKQSQQMETTREAWQEVSKPEPIGTEADYSVAPVLIILFGDVRTKEGLPMGVRYDQNRLQIIYTSSLANAFLYMHLAATTLGLASQWVSAVQTPYAHCMLKNLLGIPQKMEVYDMMALGYPALKPRPKLMRDSEKMIHYDYCGVDKFRIDEEVNDFIKRARRWNIATHSRKKDK
jgi:nitroreductase